MRKVLFQLAAIGVTLAFAQPGAAQTGGCSRDVQFGLNVDGRGNLSAGLIIQDNCGRIVQDDGYREDRSCERPCYIDDRLWYGIQSGGSVYVDGCFRGRGVAALVHVGAGRRRVSVLTHSGRKLSAWVIFPASVQRFSGYDSPRYASRHESSKHESRRHDSRRASR